MSMSTEDLLRQALQRQADRAVDPDRVRAALPARATRRSRRRYGSMAGGLVAAAALAVFAVPVLALDDAGSRPGPGPAGDGPGASPAGTPAATEAPAMPGAVALRYRPTWLPPGLVERSRTVPIGPGNVYDGPLRIWKRQNSEAGFDMGGSRLEFGAMGLKDGANQFGDAGEVVDINGRPGRLVGAGGEGKSYLHWLIDPQTVILVNNVEMGVSDADLLQIARSVQADPGELAIPVRLGRLPAGMAPFSAQFSGDSPSSWQLEITALDPGQADAGQPSGDKAAREKKTGQGGERWIYVRLGRTADVPDGGEAADVAGRPGWIATRPAQGPVPGAHVYVMVDVGSGLNLTVYGATPAVSREDLIAVAAGAQVGPAPDLRWLGAR